MKSASVADAKTHLSSLLAEVEAGRDVTITRRGRPIARLTAVVAATEAARRFDRAALQAYVAVRPVRSSRRPLSVAQMRERDLL